MERKLVDENFVTIRHWDTLIRTQSTLSTLEFQSNITSHFKRMVVNHLRELNHLVWLYMQKKSVKTGQQNLQSFVNDLSNDTTKILQKIPSNLPVDGLQMNSQNPLNASYYWKNYVIIPSNASVKNLPAWYLSYAVLSDAWKTITRLSFPELNALESFMSNIERAVSTLVLEQQCFIKGNSRLIWDEIGSFHMLSNQEQDLFAIDITQNQVSASIPAMVASINNIASIAYREESFDAYIRQFHPANTAFLDG